MSAQVTGLRATLSRTLCFSRPRCLWGPLPQLCERSCYLETQKWPETGELGPRNFMVLLHGPATANISWLMLNPQWAPGPGLSLFSWRKTMNPHNPPGRPALSLNSLTDEEKETQEDSMPLPKSASTENPGRCAHNSCTKHVTWYTKSVTGTKMDPDTSARSPGRKTLPGPPTAKPTAACSVPASIPDLALSPPVGPLAPSVSLTPSCPHSAWNSTFLVWVSSMALWTESCF